MVQQRNVCEYTPDDHYCAVLYKYSRQLAIMFKEYMAFTGTSDKCKIKIGELNFPAVATQGRQVLVAQGRFLQATDHDHTSRTLIPTVLLRHEISNNIDNSWYRGVPHVDLKLAATEPSSTLRNAAEVKQELISKFGKNIPPIVILYTNWGPEHRTTFLSVKIAMTALQQALYIDLLVAL